MIKIKCNLCNLTVQTSPIWDRCFQHILLRCILILSLFYTCIIVILLLFIFPSDHLTRIYYNFYVISMSHSTCLLHVPPISSSLFDSTGDIGKKYKLWNSWLCSFLQPPYNFSLSLSLSLSNRNVFLSTMFASIIGRQQTEWCIHEK